MASDFIARIRGERQTIGIDIGHYSIKVVRVYHGRGGVRRVMTADLERLPVGTLVDNEIKEAEKLTESLVRIMTRNFPDISSAEIVASVNWASGVLADRVSVKIPKNGNEDAIIIQTAQARPPFDDQDNVLDYEIISRNADGEVKATIVAAKNAMLENWSRFFHDAGYNLDAIDVDIFGLANAYMATVSDEMADQTVALFNIGEKKATVGFIMGGFFHSSRTLTSGSMDSVITMLSRHLGIDAAKCHEIFESAGTASVEGFSEADVESAMQLAFEEVASAIEFGLRYFSSSESGDKPVRILLAGGGACLPGLVKYIADKIGIETSTVNPFKRVACDPQVFGAAGISESLSNVYAPALGLALRKF